MKINEEDIRFNKETGKLEICNEIVYRKDRIDRHWEDYEMRFLHTRMGMDPLSRDVHTLQYFVDVLNANQPIKQEDTIKIRYAYLSSLTNVKEDPFYRENLRFRILSLNDLETSHAPLKDLLTLRETALIRILGRDICTGRVDMDGKDIYSGDILRWFLDSEDCILDSVDYIDETIDIYTHFYEQDTKKDCKVIGTIYDNKVI